MIRAFVLAAGLTALLVTLMLLQPARQTPVLPAPPPVPDPVACDVDALIRDRWRIDEVKRGEDWSVVLAHFEGDKTERMKAVFRVGTARGEHERDSWARWRLDEPPRDLTGDGVPEFTLWFDQGGTDWSCRGLQVFNVDGKCLTPYMEWGDVTRIHEIGGRPMLIAHDLRFQWIPFFPHSAGLAVERILTYDPSLAAFREKLDVAGPFYERRLRGITPGERDVEFLHAGLEYWMLSEILGRPALGHAYFLKVVPRDEEYFDAWERDARFMLDHFCALCPSEPYPVEDDERRDLARRAGLEASDISHLIESRGFDGVPEDFPVGLKCERGRQRWVWINGVDGRAAMIHFPRVRRRFNLEDPQRGR